MSFLTDRWDQLVDSVDRRIDNELNAEFMPSPTGVGHSDEITIKTAENETGSAKAAGTGGRYVSAIPNAALFAGLAVVGGLIAFKVLK